MKTFQQTGLVKFHLLAVLMTLIATCLFVSMANSQPSSNPDLSITTRTSEQLTGVLNGTPYDVTFDARLKTPLEVLVQVHIGDLELDASANLGEDGIKKVVIIDGHGSELSANEKQVLVTLSGLLEHYIDPYRKQVPPHEDLIVRTVGLWAEAPAGYPLTRQEIRASGGS